MRTQSMDTNPEAERVLIELIRKASLKKRFGLARSLSNSALYMHRRYIQERHSNTSKEEQALIFVTNVYGQALADGLRATLKKRQAYISDTPDLLTAMTPITEAFEQLDISYYIEGTVANSIYGMQRGTINIDVVAGLHLDHVCPLLQRLERSYHIDEEAMHDAIQHHTSFNSIHLESMLKVDVLLPKDRPFDQQVRRRVQQHVLAENTRPFCLASPEDVILTQLERYRRAGGTADDQWNEILGVLKVQGTALDLTYLQQWATTLAVADLLEEAYIDAGFVDDDTHRREATAA